MKKLLVIIAVAVSGVVNGQDYGDSLATKDFISAETVEYWMVRYINEERIKLGLDTLVYDSEINDIAKNHSAWMLQTGIFQHSKLNVYEIITHGGVTTKREYARTHKRIAKAAINCWVSSPAHYRIMTLPNIKYIGAGWAYSIGQPNGYMTYYYTATFR